MKTPSRSWGSLFPFALSWHFWKQQVAGRNHWAMGCSLCAQCEYQTKTLCFHYIHSNLREKMWSSGGAQLLPRPHHGSSIETSAILWAQPNLSLSPLFSSWFIKAWFSSCLGFEMPRCPIFPHISWHTDYWQIRQERNIHPSASKTSLSSPTCPSQSYLM